MNSKPTQTKYTKALWYPWLVVYLISVIVFPAVQLSVSFTEYSASKNNYTGPVTWDTVTTTVAWSAILCLFFVLKYLPLIIIAGRRLRNIASVDFIKVTILRYRRTLFATAAIDLCLIALPAVWFYYTRSEMSGDATLALPLTYLLIVFPALIITAIGAVFLLWWRLRHA